MINLPTYLTLQHLFDSDRKIKINSKEKKRVLTSEIQQDEVEQIQQMLKMIKSDSEQFYEQQFVRIFCLIKINALLGSQCNINQQFVEALVEAYNTKRIINVMISTSDEQFFSQVILQANLNKFIHIEDIHNILAGQCLLATTLALMIRQTTEFLLKAQITFSLSFLALTGRQHAFLPQVHQYKNHEGQIQFAKKIFQFIKIDHPEKYLKLQIEIRRVQDPYSMRCSPQVYGVIYQCLNHLKQNIDSILNKYHFKTLLIDGKQYKNLDLSADSQILKGDFLICSLNQIGHMAFLRSERILNIYLGKNEVYKQNPKEVFQLKAILEKNIHLVADNKLIAIPSNCDTMNIDNYEKDIYSNSSKVFEKYTKMMKNLYKLMLLEIETALLGLNNVYNIGEGDIFLNSTLKSSFFSLQENCSTKNRKESLFFIRKEWKLEQQN